MTNPEPHEQVVSLGGPLGIGDESAERDISDPDTPDYQKHTRH